MVYQVSGTRPTLDPLVVAAQATRLWSDMKIGTGLKRERKLLTSAWIPLAGPDTN